METYNEYSVICHFSAIARKQIKAQNYEEAKHIAESDTSIKSRDIIRITDPCKVTEVVLRDYGSQSHRYGHFEYKIWGSE